MKHLTIPAIILVSASAASAAPFDFQQQIGSHELDPSNLEGPALPVRSFIPSNVTPSLFALNQNVDIDGSADFVFTGGIVPVRSWSPTSYELVMK